MGSRYITRADLKSLSPAQVAVLHMDNDLYLSLCRDRDTLLDVLLDAPSNSHLANDTIDTLSVLVSVIDAYEHLHDMRGAA